MVETYLGLSKQVVLYGPIEAGAYWLGKVNHLAGQGWMCADGLDLALNLCLIFNNLRHG
jgi:hypothetical protein